MAQLSGEDALFDVKRGAEGAIVLWISTRRLIKGEKNIFWVDANFGRRQQGCEGCETS
jgi:hypothetical protein